MARDIGKVTTTQIGTIGENLVATQLILESNGRLSPFEPIADDTGIDLLVYDKRTGYTVPLQVKTRTKTIKRYPKIVHFEIRRATFKSKQDAFILAILFHPRTSAIEVERAWLIPMREFRQIAMKRAQGFVISPSIDMRARDKYSPYRCEGLAEATRRLVDHIDRLKK